MRDIAVSVKYPPELSVDFPWFFLRFSKISLKILHCFISYESTKNPYKFCRESPEYPCRIRAENSLQFLRGFTFHLQPKYPPSPGIPCWIRVILPAKEEVLHAPAVQIWAQNSTILPQNNHLIVCHSSIMNWLQNTLWELKYILSISGSYKGALTFNAERVSCDLFVMVKY